MGEGGSELAALVATVIEKLVARIVQAAGAVMAITAAPSIAAMSAKLRRDRR
jgi:uncharacterized membrane protein